MKPDLTSRIITHMTMWLWGGFVFYLIEVVTRGYSHPSMFVVGGLCLLILGNINNLFPWEMPLLYQCLIGGVAITAVEFISDCVLNLWWGLGVWDYSGIFANILGQICLPYSIAWCVLAGVGIWLYDFLNYKPLGEERPRYKFV